MSKRPEKADVVMSRIRRPAGRLRDLPIWSKLGLIMVVPTLATVIVGTNGLLDHIDEASNAADATTLSVLSQAAGGLVDSLQSERAFGVMIVTTDADTADRETAQTEYERVHPKVDAAKLPYLQQRTALDNIPPQVNTLLVRLDRNIGELPTTRSQTANGAYTIDDVEERYDPIIDDLLSVRDVAAQLALNTDLSSRLRLVAGVARAKEFISQQRVVGHKILGEGRLDETLRREFLETNAGLAVAEATISQVADDEDAALVERVISGPAKRTATNFTGPLESLNTANAASIPFDRGQWETAMIGYNDLYRSLENRLDVEIVDQATIARDQVQRQVFWETSLLLGLLLLAIVFAWMVARSMARSLRELRQGALNVAQFGLPQAVERLRDPALTGSLTPAQVADQVAEPLPVRSRDEFGQVTEAFNAVHLEAVRTAAEQAALRSSVATMFVNLARRSQILVDRLIGHLDRLERGEEDPDRLAELFQLDHLATRMRRNDENLLVLAGADSTRVQREPAALIDVLRAAQSEVEHYTRIEFGTIDRDIEVAAHAVNDMVHLVAELFDNATAFSPPNSHVIVEARRLGDGAVLSVEDRGIGISREQLRELNERLAAPPQVDVAVSRMMGLVVVARLANRHGVRVELRPADTERGTVADVGLPAGVLTSGAPSGRLPGGPAGPSPEPQRPAFAEPPLALEGSSPHGFGGGRAFDPNPPMTNGGLLGAGAGANGNGRSVPAWSDLTGAQSGGFEALNSGFGGSNGFGNGAANGFHGPRSNEPIPPLPQSFAGDEGMPQRRNGESFRPDETVSFGHTIPRQLPPSPESPSRPPFVPPVSAPPVPSAPPFGGPISAPPVAGPASAPREVDSAPAVPSAPPAWPPVTTDRDHPHVPERLAAALDMTAELPRYRAERNGQQPELAAPVSPAAQRSAAAAAEAHKAAEKEAEAAQATAAAQIAAAQAAARQRSDGDGQAPYADETMELPIFRELESAWFRTARPVDRKAGAEQKEDDSLLLSQRISTGEPTRAPVPQQQVSVETLEPEREPEPVSVGAAAGGGSPGHPWQTAADDGWQAARKASEAPVEVTTTAGLPRRTPMAQLVPGGVDRAETSVQRRTPEAVRGLLSAYHRGVQRGRTKDQPTNPGETPGGQQSSQAGKEHEA